MARGSKYKIGQEVAFMFAGTRHTGVVLKILDENKIKVYDDKYIYPVQIKDIIKDK